MHDVWMMSVSDGELDRLRVLEAGVNLRYVVHALRLDELLVRVVASMRIHIMHKVLIIHVVKCVDIVALALLVFLTRWNRVNSIVNEIFLARATLLN